MNRTQIEKELKVLHKREIELREQLDKCLARSYIKCDHGCKSIVLHCTYIKYIRYVYDDWESVGGGFECPKCGRYNTFHKDGQNKFKPKHFGEIKSVGG